jgi:hypothetical protein
MTARDSSGNPLYRIRDTNKDQINLKFDVNSRISGSYTRDFKDQLRTITWLCYGQLLGSAKFYNPLARTRYINPSRRFTYMGKPSAETLKGGEEKSILGGWSPNPGFISHRPTVRPQVTTARLRPARREPPRSPPKPQTTAATPQSAPLLCSARRRPPTPIGGTATVLPRCSRKRRGKRAPLRYSCPFPSLQPA